MKFLALGMTTDTPVNAYVTMNSPDGIYERANSPSLQYEKRGNQFFRSGDGRDIVNLLADNTIWRYTWVGP